MNQAAPPPTRCLTSKFNGRARVLHNECKLSLPFDLQKPVPPGAFVPFQAIWDTGASGTVITEAAAKKVGLVPTGQSLVRGVHGEKLANTYIVNICLPGNVVFAGLVVTEGELGGNFDLLIGMDIIGMGDFAVTHPGGKTVMTFRVPSSANIDFVKETNDATFRQMAMQRGKNHRPTGPGRKSR